MRSAPSRFASKRSAPVRSAPLRFAPLRSAPLSFAPLRSAPSRFVPPSFAPERFAPQSSAPLRFAPPRSAPQRSASTLGALALQAFQTSTPCRRSSRCSELATSRGPSPNSQCGRRTDETRSLEAHPCSHLGIEGAEAAAGAMLAACRLAGLSALEAQYAGVRARAQCGRRRVTVGACLERGSPRRRPVL